MLNFNISKVVYCVFILCMVFHNGALYVLNVFVGGRSGDSYDRSDTIKDSMCGQKNPFSFTASDRRIWIRFKSDSFNTGRGFVLGYVMYDSSKWYYMYVVNFVL